MSAPQPSPSAADPIQVALDAPTQSWATAEETAIRTAILCAIASGLMDPPNENQGQTNLVVPLLNAISFLVPNASGEYKQRARLFRRMTRDLLGEQMYAKAQLMSTTLLTDFRPGVQECILDKLRTCDAGQFIIFDRPGQEKSVAGTRLRAVWTSLFQPPSLSATGLNVNSLLAYSCPGRERVNSEHESCSHSHLPAATPLLSDLRSRERKTDN